MDDYIPISALNQYAYCPHRCWRMYCLGGFVENQHTVEGTRLHERVHSLGEGQRGEVAQVRAIWLKSERYGLIGKSDLVEETEGCWYPVEYKRGGRGEFENDAIQVCAQALCLEEMTGEPVTLGYLYYAQSHQRQAVEIGVALREQTVAAIAAVRRILETGGDAACGLFTALPKGCSLYEQCLPKAAEKVRRYRESY